VNLAETIRETIDRHNLIPVDTEVVIGVSGGADSIALLHALHALKIPATIAHLNHQLRGAEAEADERFVRKLASELGFHIICKSVDVKQLADDNGISIEMAARRARHDFFATFDNAVIVLAHHADDQAETFLLKLARGAGTEGLGGMPYFQQIDALRLIRPMLDIPRAEIIGWLEENGFKWREDASNQDVAFLRNRVRHTVLPLLEQELNPNIRETILRTMNILREENAWMEKLETGNRKLETDAPLAAKRRSLRKWLFDNGAEGVDFNAVDSILQLMDTGNGTTVFELNDRQRVVIEYGTPRFEQAEGRQKRLPHVRLTSEPGTGWRKDHGKGVGILPAEASFAAEKVGDSPITVRGWESGDRIDPLGLEGRCKLQDIFTNQKVPRTRRASIPVVVCQGEIIWIPGYRIARGWEVQGSNGKAIHVRIEQNRDE